MPGGMVPRPDQLMGGLPLGVEKLGGEFERHKRDSNLPNWSPIGSPPISSELKGKVASSLWGGYGFQQWLATGCLFGFPLRSKQKFRRVLRWKTLPNSTES